jgi:hypothetical protein
MEHEVKEAKADALCAATKCADMKGTLAEFQTKTNEALEAMVANHQELIASLGVRDDNVKRALDRRDDRLDRHSRKIEEKDVKVDIFQHLRFAKC